MEESISKKKLELSLFFLRIGVFIVFFMWTLDKFINPEHTASVFKRYYLIGGVENGVAYFLGTLQLMLILGFLFGIKKKFTYGALFFFHTISTLSTWQKMIDPWSAPNLLFYTSIPMLAGIFVLYSMRDEDKKFTIKTKI